MNAIAIISLIQSLAPAVRGGVRAVNALRAEFNRLIERGEVTAEEQAEFNAQVEDIFSLFQPGQELPDHWKVRPDPQ